MSETAGVPKPQKPETWNESTARLIAKRLETIRKIVAEIDSGTKSAAYIADAEITLSKLFESIEELQRTRMENVREKEIESDVGISAREVEKLLRRVRKGEMKRVDVEDILKEDPVWSALYQHTLSPQSTGEEYPQIPSHKVSGKAFYRLLAHGAHSRETAVPLETIASEVYGDHYSSRGWSNSESGAYGMMQALKKILLENRDVPYELSVYTSGTNRPMDNLYWLKKR